MSGMLLSERAEALTHHILLMPGIQRHVLAFAAGLAAALALAPLDFLPGFLLAFPLLVLLVDNGEYAGKGGVLSGFGRAAITGWWFGFGYFLAGLWWLGAAFIAGGDQFIWLMPLGVVGLPAFLALFPALGVGIARLLWCSGPLRVFALAFGLSLSEWLRSFLFTGFPWNSFGQAFANHLTLVQAASLIGADGLGVLAIVMFSTPALILTGRDGLERWALPCASALMLTLLFLFGWLRLEGAGGSRIDMRTLPVVADVQLRIVQPNRKLEPRDQAPDGMAVLRTLLSLSDRASGPQAMGVGDVTHLIWPEAPLPFVLERAPEALEAIRTFLPANTRLITGGIRTEADPNEPGRTRFFNTMQVIDQSGISAQYDKVHLVPFGEYLPFDLFLRAIGLEQFVRVVGGFTAAPRRVRLPVPGLPPVIPLICFESIFVHELEAGEEGGKVFINITNDAWFGHTPGPYQHLAQARLRSVELGQPLVRAANSGISAVFDPYGRVVSQSHLDRHEILDAPLPQGLTNTLYRRASWYSFVSVMVCCLIFAFAGWLRR